MVIKLFIISVILFIGIIFAEYSYVQCGNCFSFNLCKDNVGPAKISENATEEEKTEATDEAESAGAIETEDGYKLGQDEYLIDVEEKDGNKILANEKAGISLTVPSDWYPELAYSTETNKEIKLKVFKSGPTQPDEPSEITDGIMLEVDVWEDGNIGLKEWLQKEDIKDCKSAFYRGMESCRKTKDFSEIDKDDMDAPVWDNWSDLEYIVKKGSKFYELYCYSAGELYKEYSKECEKILINNLVIE